MRGGGLTTVVLIVIILAQEHMLVAHGLVSTRNKKNKKRLPQIETRGTPMIPRPRIPTTSFAHKSALNDGIQILPASHGKGMGAFADIDIVKGDIVGEYSGEIITRREVEARYWGLRKANKHDRKWRNSRKRRDQGISGDYLFDMGNDSFIDGEDAEHSSWCRFANHADPNKHATNDNDDDETTVSGNNACNVEARARIKQVVNKANDINNSNNPNDDGDPNEKKHLYFIALMDIGRGSELCYDYGEEYWDANGFV